MSFDIRNQWKSLLAAAVVFVVFYFLPVGWERFDRALGESLKLTRWYAREHVLLCLVPAFFLAGAIGVFLSQSAVMKYLGAGANKVLAYGVASVSGSILAVCSCTVLPLFAGIYRMGAGIGPATAFLYSGPAINVLAIILTARILGPELGIARAVGAVVFAVLIGAIMHLIYRREEADKSSAAMALPQEEPSRPLWQNAVFFALMIGVLVFANWGPPNIWTFTTTDGQTLTGEIVQAPFDPHAPQAAYTINLTDDTSGHTVQLPAAAIASRRPIGGVWTTIWQSRWRITATLSAVLGVVLVAWFALPWWKVLAAAIPSAALAALLPGEGLWVAIPFTAGVVGLGVALATTSGEPNDWLEQSWSFARQITPLLLIGVLVAGFLLGRPGHPGFIPPQWVERLMGERPDSLIEAAGITNQSAEALIRSAWPVWTNLFASLLGALMYFATLTEVPILQGLIGAGMGKGPALALLLAGPALSLPNMLVIASVLGVRKTAVFVMLVVVMATVSGIVFGTFF